MPIEQTVSESQVNPALLRQDIRLLGEYLGNTLKEQVSDSTFEQVVCKVVYNSYILYRTI